MTSKKYYIVYSTETSEREVFECDSYREFETFKKENEVKNVKTIMSDGVIIY